MSADDQSRVARSHWRYWLAVAVVGVGLAASFLWIKERPPAESNTNTRVTASNLLTRGFPPPFSDSRPDLSQRPDFVELCGVGRVQLLPGGDLDLPDKVAASEQWLEQAAARLAASGNDYDRAVGLYVQAGQAAYKAMSKYLATRRDCVGDDKCMTEAIAVAQDAGAAASDQLARHAVASRSPSVYALAFYRCGNAAGNSPAGGACAQISSAQWAQIEPGNAAPWLYEAEAAARHMDTKGVDEAMLHASKADAMRVHDEALLRLMDPSILRTNDPVTVAMAQVQSIGSRASLPAPDGVAARYCGPSAATDGPRRLLCSDLAAVLVDRSSALLSMGVGARIGERAGWPPERVAAARDFTSAISQVWAAESYDPKDRYSCRALELNNKRFSEIFRYGEVEAAKRQIQASGKSVAELAREWKQSQSAMKDAR